MHVTTTVLSNTARSANYSQSQPFTEAGENLTFDRHRGESYSFSRSHLVYCECAGAALRFRFPLYEVEIQTSTPAAELLEAVLTGRISVLHEANVYVNNTSLADHLRQVEKITVRDQHED